VRIVAPDKLLGTIGFIDYGPEDIERLIELGRTDAENKLKD
jgi:hypothetical protein